jgi:hypothetical protein
MPPQAHCRLPELVPAAAMLRVTRSTLAALAGAWCAGLVSTTQLSLPPSSSLLLPLLLSKLKLLPLLLPLAMPA